MGTGPVYRPSLHHEGMKGYDLDQDRRSNASNTIEISDPKLAKVLAWRRFGFPYAANLC